MKIETAALTLNKRRITDWHCQRDTLSLGMELLVFESMGKDSSGPTIGMTMTPWMREAWKEAVKYPFIFTKTFPLYLCSARNQG